MSAGQEASRTTASRFGFALLAAIGLCAALPGVAAEHERTRVFVSTDIGGSDPDDFQSMVHLLLYADALEIEGLVSSPWGAGRKADILAVIDVYARDYGDLSANAPRYPAPEALRAVTRQGATGGAPWAGYSVPTEGSEWLVEAARRDDPRPLHVLVWGGIEDLAQALHDAPDILPRLRVYFIGGPNKKWSTHAYQYIADRHPALWIIESNATYRGWFVGGNQSGEWGNRGFVERHVAGQGALGKFFAGFLDGEIKMGDTPSVAWLLHGTPQDPTRPGWGGSFVRAWPRPHAVFDGVTTRGDRIEQFGIAEFVFPAQGGRHDTLARLVIDNQALAGTLDDEGNLRFRFSPKEARVYEYRIEGGAVAPDGLAGAITATPLPPDAAARPDAGRPNWWTDDPDPALAEQKHYGAKTVNRWREDFLRDFAARFGRTRATAAPPAGGWSGAVLHRAADWYATDGARAVADSVVAWQSVEGGWPKNIDLTGPATADALALAAEQGRANTIDNGATVLPMRFLARVAGVAAADAQRYEAAFLRGFDYLLEAQYANGGWPQFYPLKPGYFTHITFNDNAMVNVMRLLRDVADRRAEFAFVDAARRAAATDALERGLDCILATQVRQDGKLAGWSAQYDEVTLEPAWARAYEPPSLSGMETVPIVRYLMDIEAPSAAVIAAIEGAVAWLGTVAIHDVRYERFTTATGESDAIAVAEPGAGPIWARFYDLETNRPLFTGRDSVVRHALSEIEMERRGGYAYYGTWPATLLLDEYPEWRGRVTAR